MKTILTLLAAICVAGNLNAQSLLPMDSTQRNLAQLDRDISGASYYLGLYIQSLSRVHASVWGKPDAELAAMLTAVGPEGVAQLVALHAAAATAANSIAEAAGIPARAPVEPSREFSFDPQTGHATVVPLPEPEPTPTPTDP
jgi:hypothetical protein